jgi:hypothetical protein
LLVLYCFGDNLGIEMIVEEMVQVGLYWEWLKQKLLVKFFL